MKLEIFNESKPKQEKKLILRSVENLDGITWMAVDESGERSHGGNLFSLNNDGTLYLYTDVSPDLGLVLDSNGRIVVSIK